MAFPQLLVMLLNIFTCICQAFRVSSSGIPNQIVCSFVFLLFLKSMGCPFFIDLWQLFIYSRHQYFVSVVCTAKNSQGFGVDLIYSIFAQREAFAFVFFFLMSAHLKCFHFVIGLPWWLSGKEFACNVGDLGLIPGSGRSPGEGKGHLLQYSCLENSMDRGA